MKARPVAARRTVAKTPRPAVPEHTTFRRVAVFVPFR